jgi:hypothetical protein
MRRHRNRNAALRREAAARLGAQDVGGGGSGLAHRLLCNAGVGIRHVKPVPLDIVQAFLDVNAGLFLTSHQLDCFEGGPGSVLDGKVATLAVTGEAEYATFASEDMNLHGQL